MDIKTVRLNDNDNMLGLTKIVGSGIKEIVGYASESFDGQTVFKMTKIIFDDGTELLCEGEHDTPYLATAGDKTPPNYSDEIIEDLFIQDQENNELDE